MANSAVASLPPLNSSQTAQRAASAAAAAATPSYVLSYTPPNKVFQINDTYKPFQTFVWNAMAKNQVTGVKVTPGNYSTSNTKTPGYGTFTFDFYCPTSRQFTLDFTNVNFILDRYDQGIMSFAYCNKLTVIGPASVTYAPAAIPFTQGILTAVSTDNTNFTVVVDAGFPTDNIMLNQPVLIGVLYDAKTLHLKVNVSDVYGTNVVKLSAGTYIVSTGYGVGAAVGDLITFRGPCGYCHGMYVTQTTNSVFRDMTINMSPGFGVFEIGGGGNSYSGLQIVPQIAQPPQSPRAPLLSSAADGFHSAAASIGPQISNSKVNQSGDDAYAVHGYFILLVAYDPSTLSILVADSSDAYFPDGAKLQLYDSNQKALGQALITAQASATNPGLSGNSNLLGLELSTAFYHNITLNATVPGLASAGLPGILFSPQTVGNGLSITSSSAYYNRGRGMLLKASGTIRGNTIVGPKFWGIQMVPELYFHEAGFYSNVTVAQNFISAPSGGILSGAFTKDGQWLPYQQNTNLLFTNNTIQNTAYASMILSSSSSVQISNTRIVSAYCYPFIYTSYLTGPGYPQGALIWITQSTNVKISGTFVDNTDMCKYGNYKQPVAYTQESNVTIT